MKFAEGSSLTLKPNFGVQKGLFKAKKERKKDPLF